jgi:Family of unknown function (DUF6270)
MDLAIYGGCVSRDIFRIFPENDQVKLYIARTSLISQMSEPTRLNIDDINLTSNFQKRLVLADFRKTMKDNIENADVDYFIIDFLVERLHLYFNGEKYITRSSELENSGITKNSKYKLGKVIHRKIDNLELLSEWYKACEEFIKLLQQKFQPENIILHKVFLTEDYIEDSVKKKFTDEKLLEIQELNKLLDMYYSFFEQNYKNINTIQVDPKHCIADANHNWGLNPMHFVDDYYLDARNQLNKIYLNNGVNI